MSIEQISPICCSGSRGDHNTMAAYLLVKKPILFLARPTTIVMLDIHVSTISAHLFRVFIAHPAPPPFPHNSAPADILGWWRLDLRWVSFHHTSIWKNRTLTLSPELRQNHTHKLSPGLVAQTDFLLQSRLVLGRPVLGFILCIVGAFCGNTWRPSACTCRLITSRRTNSLITHEKPRTQTYIPSTACSAVGVSCGNICRPSGATCPCSRLVDLW